jgi:hypothetical protein
MPDVGEAEAMLIDGTIFVRHAARDSVAKTIHQMDQKARAIFQRPVWEGLGGNKPIKWASLHKTHFRDKVFLQTGKGSRKTPLGPGWTELKFIDHKTEKEVKRRAEEVLGRLEDGRTAEGKPFMRPPKKAEPLPRPPPVPGKDVSALLYLIAAYPARVLTALAKIEATDEAAAAGAVTIAVEHAGAEKAKRGRGSDTKGIAANDIFARLEKLENDVHELQCQAPSMQRRKADLAYYMPLAPGRIESDFEPGEVVAIVEASATRTLEVRKLTDAAAGGAGPQAADGGRNWYPAVISGVWYHAANEQPEGTPAVTVCMLPGTCP